MKKKKVLKVLSALSLLGVVSGLAACKQKDTAPAPEENTTPEVEVVNKNDFYYCDADEQEYFFSFTGDKFVVFAVDKNYTGTLTKSNDEFVFNFDENSDNASAVFVGDNIHLTLNGEVYVFSLRKTFKVSYVDGTANVGSEVVVNGRIATQPESPKKDGYTFVGWYTSDDYSQLFDFENTKIAKDTTVYARFVENKVGKLEFVANYYVDGELFSTKETVSGVLYNLPTPTVSGKEFVGWWVSDSGDPSKVSYKYEGQELKANTTLVAVWKQDKPMVSVTGDKISWTSVGVNVNYVVVVTDSDDVEVKRESTNTTSLDFSFAELPAGEYTVTVSGSGKIGTANYSNKVLNKVSKFSVVDGILVFNPVDGASKYLVYVDCKDSAHNHNPFDLGKNTSYDFSGCQMQEGGIKFTVVAEANGYISSESEVFVYNKVLNAVTGLSVEDEFLIWNSVDNATSYVVEVTVGEDTYKFNVGNVTTWDLKYFSGELSVVVYPVAPGYNTTVCDAVEYNKTTLQAPTNVGIQGEYIVWDEVEGAVSYNVKIGKNVYSAETNALELSTDLLEDNQISYQVEVQAVADDAKKNSKYSDTLVVNYLVLADTVKYENGYVSWDYVAGAVAYAVKVNDEAAFDVLSGNSAAVTFTKPGVNKVYVSFYDSKGRQSSWKSVSVYVQTINFVGCGGEDLDPIYKVVGDEVELPETTYAGYMFAGWYNLPNGPVANGVKYDDDFVMPSKDVFLYAYWRSKEFSITFDGVDGRGTLDVESSSVYYKESYKLPVPTPEVQNVVFDGWYTEANGVGLKLTDDNGNSTGVWNIADDAVVYANWINIVDFIEVTGGYRAQPGAGFNLVTEVTIPAEYEDGVVVELGSFASSTNLYVLNVPNTVQFIDYALAFTGCTKLEAINVYEVEGVEPNDVVYKSYGGVLYMNDTASEYAGWEVKLVPSQKSGDYTIMPGTVSIPNKAFASSKITEVVIPYTVKNIGEQAFYSSTKLVTITFEATPEDVEETELRVGKQAFQSCSSLTDFTLPKRLSVFDETAFDSCRYLENIFTEEGMEMFTSKDGVLCNADGTEILYCPKGKTGEFVIPAGVSTIGQSAFASCTKLTKITISESVKEIKKEAFKSCSAITEVEFLGDEDSAPLAIREQAFYSCSGLTELVFPANLTVLEKNSFGSTSKLEKVTVTSVNEISFATGVTQAVNATTGVGASYVTELNIGAFVQEFDVAGVFGGSNDKLSVINVDPNNTYYTAIDDVLFNKDVTKVLFYPASKTGSYTLPDTVVEIGAAAFRNRKNLLSFTIGKNVTTIGNEAFYSCSNITSLTFEAGGTEPLVIGKNAFQYCSSLTELELPSRLTEIQEYGFANLSKLKEIVIPEGVTTVGEFAFAWASVATKITIPSTLEAIGEFPSGSGNGTDISTFRFNNKLMEFVVAETNPVFAAYDGVLYTKTNGVATTLCLCPLNKVGSLVVPKTVSSISSRAFYNNATITDISFEDHKSAVTVVDGEEVEGTLTVGTDAFYWMRELKSIELPNIVTMQDSLFYYCQKLETFNVPKTVTSIGIKVFYYCKALKTVTFEEGGTEDLIIKDGTYTSDQYGDYVYSAFGASGLESIELPARTKEIGNVAFAKNDNLTSIKIPANVTRIGDRAFYYCQYLTKVEFEEDSNLGKIGQYAFYYAKKLEDFELPASVTTIGTYAFYQCVSLKSITIPAGMTKIDASTFTFCGFETVNFAEGCQVKEFGNYAFEYCRELTSFTVPETVEKLGTYVFAYDSKLTTINFAGDKIHTIDNYCFAETAIEEFTFPTYKKNNVVTAFTKIGTYLFSKCPNLKVVHLSGSVNAVSDVFTNCTTIEEFTISEDNVNLALGKISGVDVLLNKAETSIKFVLGAINGKFNIPDTITTIETRAFASQTGITEVYIPASVTEIGNYAFDKCTGLKKVTFDEESPITKGASVTTGKSPNTIGTYVFEYCSSLTDVTLPKGLTTIPEYLFQYCSSLESITLPAAVTSIGKYAFRYTTALNSINLPAKLTTINSYAFAYSAIPTIEIPAAVTKIDTYAFNYCKSLKTVTFKEGSKLTTLNGSAFAYSGLESIVLPDSLTTVGSSIFSNCEKLTDVTLPSKATSLGSSLFLNCTSLTNIEIPTSVTKIDASCFSKSGLTSITIPSSVKTMAATMFQNCLSLKSAVIDASVTALPDSMFDGCENLTSVQLVEGITTIGQKDFQNCKSLKTITLPSSLTRLCNYAFAGSGLESISLPVNFQNFGGTTATTALTYSTTSYIFQNCENLKSVEFEGNKVALITAYTFQNTKSLTDITIPRSVTGIGNYAFNNSAIEDADLSNVTTYGNYIFQGAGSLRNVVLSQKMTAIPTYMFQNCKSLTTIALPATVKTINNYAFDGAGLTKINLLTVTSLGTYVFRNNTALAEVTLSDDLKTLPNYTFYGCTSLNEITLPSTLGSLGTYVFAYSGLKGITIPGSIEVISDYCFQYCDKLANVNFAGEKLIQINQYAFEGCSSLKFITLPETLATLGNFVFQDAGLIGTLNIPASVTKMGSNPFAGATNLSKVVIDANNGTFKNDEHGAIYQDNELVYYPENAKGEVVLPEGTVVRANAFERCDFITKITLPSDTTEILNGAFAYITDLNELVLPEGLTTINQYAFRNSKIDKLVIPSTVNKLDLYSFGYLTTDEITVPEGITEIPNYCFAYSTIGKVNFPNSLTKFGQYVFRDTVTTFEIPASVTELSSYAFAYSKLEEVTIPATVTTIGTYLFYNSKDLKKVTFGEGTEQIVTTSANSYMFQNCESLEEVIMPDTVTVLPAYMFTSSGIKEVTIPAGVKNLPTYCFSTCANLVTVHLPETLETIGASAFRSSGIETITIPAGVVDIPSYCFDSCKNLKTLDLPNTVETIGTYAFEMSGLVSITIPEKVKIIQTSLFKDCFDLETVVIKGKLETMYGTAFNNCTSIKLLVIDATNLTTVNACFKYWTSDQTIAFTCSKEQAGLWSSSWKDDCGANIVFNYVIQ